MPATTCYFAWGCFRYFSWKREPRRPLRLSQDGLPSRSSRTQPAFAQVGFGAAAFTRFASEGWWGFLDTYRTFCLVPASEIREIFEGLSPEVTVAANG
jgi:hypothetical protein